MEEEGKSPEGKVRLKCGTESCGCEWEVLKDAIKHDKSVYCPFCSWDGKNPHFVGPEPNRADLTQETAFGGKNVEYSIDDAVGGGEEALREQTPNLITLRQLVFDIKAKHGLTFAEIAKRCGWDRSYITHLLNQFAVYFPKTERARADVLNKLKNVLING